MPFWNITRKDLRILFRDRSALVYIFGMPVMFVVTFGMIFGGGGNQNANPAPVKLLVCNLDRGPQGRKLITTMGQMGLSIEEDTAGEQDTLKRVRSGDRAMGIVIPRDFSATLEKATQTTGDEARGAPVQAHLQVLVDPAQASLAGMAQGALFGAAQRVAGPLYRAAALERVPAVFRNYAAKMMGGGSSEGGAHSTPRSAVALDMAKVDSGEHSGVRSSVGNAMVPGYAVLFAFFLANSVATALIMERQEGTLRRMLCAPIARGQILFGKLLARGILGAMQVALLFVIGSVWLHLTPGSSPLGVALTAVATIFAATGLGLLIATFGKTVEQIAGMTTLALFLMGAISGCMVPRMLLPEAMQKISLITPHAWALTAYQDLMLRNLPLVATLPNILVVFLFGLGFYSLALARFRYE